MDTSRRFTSPRLRMVKRENKLHEKLTSREYAQLIFDEIEDMSPYVFDLLFVKTETGVAIDYGTRTVSYRQLGMSTTDVCIIRAASQPLVRNTPQGHLWGILMVKREGRQLIWVKTYGGDDEPEVIVLTPELLMQLFDEPISGESAFKVLDGSDVYVMLAEVMTRKALHYDKAANQLRSQAALIKESSHIMLSFVRAK